MKKKLSIILVLFWMLVIFIMSSYNGQESSNQSGLIVNIISSIFKIENINLLTLIIRKLAHFTEYFILGILVYNMIYNYKLKQYISVIICLLYAISDEIHQIYVPGRSCQITDILIDTLGSVIGIFIISSIYKYVFRVRK